MKILGIDPGYAILGYGVVEMRGNHFTACGFGAVTTGANEEMTSRLKHIYHELMNVIAEFEPEAASIEELFFNTNQKTIIAVSEARGVILLAAQKNKLDIGEYTPLQVKQSVVGYGRAEKVQVMTMVKNILNLEKIPKPDDAADALAIAICHAHSKSTSSLISRFT